jgi:hypothetical protein
MTQVTVLGCGPAGLLAAQGAADAGADVTIISNKVRSRIAGAQFIHEEIPGLNLKRSEVHMIKRGSAEGYARKVYGEPDKVTSWASFEHGEVLPCWSMTEVYNELWSRWEGRIVSELINRELLDRIAHREGPIISTIPAHALCYGDHIFEANEIAIDVGQDVMTSRNSIIYNGDPKQRWCRSSFLFGSFAVEFGSINDKPAAKGPPLSAIRIQKPQWTDCDCRPGMMRVGRYGQWKRGVLAHSAYFDTRDALLRV